VSDRRRDVRAHATHPLARLRRQLAAWYVATLGLVLLLLGVGLFLVIQHQFALDLDASLADATAELERAADIREQEANVRGHVVDAVDELHIPERSLYLFDLDGRPVRPVHADAWIARAARSAAQSAARSGRVDVDHELSRDAALRLHAERFRLPSGAQMVAVAVADKVELEDRYAALIAAFGVAAGVALVLVSASGWLLVRKSTAPVQRTIDHMRRFMADAAHELRTPITVLRSRADVALQQPREPEAYVAALVGIAAESERMGRIVEDLLTLARADADERPIERRRLFLDDVTLDAAGAAHAMAQAKGVELAVDEFEEAPVDGDASLLRQLVMILLDNAVKFTPPGGRVYVRVGSAAARPTLVIADNGPGIAAEHLPRVFDRFYRADAARSRSEGRDGASAHDGAGLGLSIARWIAASHGADIRLASTPGEGTTATVIFPPAPPAPARPAPPLGTPPATPLPR
jgi:signal transduction histidine kinase